MSQYLVSTEDAAVREPFMKVWLLEEESLYDLAASEPKKHELSDISELPEKSD